MSVNCSYGGFIGVASDNEGGYININNCISTCKNTNNIIDAGNFINSSNPSGNLSCNCCYWDSEASGCDYDEVNGTEPKTTAEMKLETTYSGCMSFPNPWKIDGINNNGFPFLVSEGISIASVENEIKSAITGYINNLGIGDDDPDNYELPAQKFVPAEKVQIDW